jgi:hypothetical protein
MSRARMQRYGGADRDSGIDAYEVGANYMRVRFINGGTYLYTYRSAGKRHIENMKALAYSGRGLNTYINDNVRQLFERKEN